jgi:translation initiation factor IF-2
MMEKGQINSPSVSQKKGKVPEFAFSSKELRRKLEIILKADSMGTREAVVSAIESMSTPAEVELEIIQAGVGNVSKSDLLMAEAGSRLIIGFNVDILPRVKELAKEHQVEVRLYRVIYNLVDDLKKIASSLTKTEENEKVTGKATVIAVFPGGRKSVILGCRVDEGVLAVGKRFRLISDPGPVYSGTVESLHIEKDSVQQAKPGQQVGLKISGFKRAKIGDFVECFEVERPRKQAMWVPKGGVFRF